jgi:RNA polymerase sigma-54 factor
MRIDTGQHMRIDQRMKLAPRMIQSMEILQMAQAALEARIDQELASNPTLEVREPGTDYDDIEAERTQADRDNREGERELVVKDGDTANTDDFERLSNISEELGSSWDANTSETGGSYHSTKFNDGERDKKMDAMANTAARTASLFDQLMDQWHLVETTP